MGRRGRRRAREGAREAPRATTTAYTDEAGNVLTLRDELSPGTLRELERLSSAPAASGDDLWQRRVELLFERLAVRWEIAGLPLEGQRELLGRYRMASPEERRSARSALNEHVRAHHPGLDL